MSLVFGVCGKKFNRWYKDIFSGFTFVSEQEEFTKYNTVDPNCTEKIITKIRTPDVRKVKKDVLNKDTGEITQITKLEQYTKITTKVTTQDKTVKVPILIEENFGENMCIDDKNIGKEEYSIVINADTGKVAAMIESRKSSIVQQVLSDHVSSSTLFGVKTITKDFAAGYERVSKQCFPIAIRIGDKFHAVQQGINMLRSMRSRITEMERSKQRQRIESHKSREAEYKISAESQGGVYKIQPLPPEKKYRNGETVFEILKRSNRALSQFSNKWGKAMKERIGILFEEFPELKKAYSLICGFRGIYQIGIHLKDFSENTYKKAKDALGKWLKSVGAQPITELQNFASFVKKHEDQVLAYFLTGKTNAKAEALNSKIQRIIINNYGIRNTQFFLYRIKKILT